MSEDKKRIEAAFTDKIWWELVKMLLICVGSMKTQHNTKTIVKFVNFSCIIFWGQNVLIPLDQNLPKYLDQNVLIPLVSGIYIIGISEHFGQNNYA